MGGESSAMLRRSARLNLRLRVRERQTIDMAAARAAERPAEWARRALMAAAQQGGKAA